MAFSKWLQYIFRILGDKGDFPSRSIMGAQAVREFDRYPNASA